LPGGTVIDVCFFLITFWLASLLVPSLDISGSRFIIFFVQT
jgi:hypothetical protein